MLETLRKNSEGEPGNSFENRLVKAELSNLSEDEPGYELLSNVENLLSKRSRLNREVRASERELNANVQERILSLSDEEIDHLVYEKWFGEIVQSMVDLTEQPLMDDIETLKMLDERYSETLDDLDNEINELHKAFEELASQLVVLP